MIMQKSGNVGFHSLLAAKKIEGRDAGETANESGIAVDIADVG